MKQISTREILCVTISKKQVIRDTMHASVQTKQTTLNFLAQTSPKIDLGFKIQKTNVEIRISILETPCVPIFKQNGQL